MKTKHGETRGRIFDLIEEEDDLTAETIAFLLHLTKHVVQDHIRTLRKPDNRRIHVSGWQEPEGPKGVGRRAPKFSAGDLPDVPEPRVTTEQLFARIRTYQHNYYARNREYYLNYCAHWRERRKAA